MKHSRFYTWLAVCLVTPLLAGCGSFSDWFNARDNFTNGVRAFRETNYEVAAEYFEQALEFDPDTPNGELYLGLSYSQQFIPGLSTPENDQNAAKALEVFDGILAREPLNATAIAAIASIYQNTLELEEARRYYILQTEASPDDPVGYYSVGSINWYILNSLEIENTDEEKAALIAEAHEYLDRALALDPTYDAAATYKNLQFREESYLIPLDTEDEVMIARREELTALADEWFARAMTMREENAERDAQGLELD